MLCGHFLVVLLGLVASAFGKGEWVVQTEQGLVRGSWDEAGHYSFWGIPYADPPLGEYRFQAPRAKTAWDGIFEADRGNVFCPQMAGGIYVGELDCLVLNIYTPKTASSTNSSLPVMVFIHGGGFTVGSCFHHGPRHLVPHEVIVVVINYRLGVTGFLCLGHELNPGNAGMKDQVAALRWLQQNIAAFGGNPDNVTLFGQSAGSVSVDLLNLSPMAKGLFKRAIAQSGGALSTWAINVDPLRYATLIAKAAGYSGGVNVKDLMNFHMNTDLESIVRAESRLHTVGVSFPYTPCVETGDFGQEKFLTQMPLEIIRSGNYTSIPLIVGVTEKEVYGMNLNSEDAGAEYILRLEKYLPADLAFLSDENKTRVADKLRKFYFSGSPALTQYLRFNTDIYFFISGARTVQERVRTSTEPVYFYEFRYDNLQNIRPTHGAELNFLTLGNSNKFAKPADQLVGDRMSTLWTNFAKFGHPTPEPTRLLPLNWSPVSKEQFNYLIMDKQFSVEQSPHAAAFKLWTEIYDEFY